MARSLFSAAPLVWTAALPYLWSAPLDPAAPPLAVSSAAPVAASDLPIGVSPDPDPCLGGEDCEGRAEIESRLTPVPDPIRRPGESDQ